MDLEWCYVDRGGSSWSNDADGASIPFSNVNGLNYGTTDWIDENIYPDYIILGMQD